MLRTTANCSNKMNSKCASTNPLQQRSPQVDGPGAHQDTTCIITLLSLSIHCPCRKCYLMISVQSPSKPSYAKVDASKTVCQASNSFTPDPSVAGSYRCAVLSVTCPKQEVSVYGKGGKIIGKAKFTGVL